MERKITPAAISDSSVGIFIPQTPSANSNHTISQQISCDGSGFTYIPETPAENTNSFRDSDRLSSQMVNTRVLETGNRFNNVPTQSSRPRGISVTFDPNLSYQTASSNNQDTTYWTMNAEVSNRTTNASSPHVLPNESVYQYTSARLPEGQSEYSYPNQPAHSNVQYSNNDPRNSVQEIGNQSGYFRQTQPVPSFLSDIQHLNTDSWNPAEVTGNQSGYYQNKPIPISGSQNQNMSTDPRTLAQVPRDQIGYFCQNQLFPTPPSDNRNLINIPQSLSQVPGELTQGFSSLNVDSFGSSANQTNQASTNYRVPQQNFNSHEQISLNAASAEQLLNQLSRILGVSGLSLSNINSQVNTPVSAVQSHIPTIPQVSSAVISVPPETQTVPQVSSAAISVPFETQAVPHVSSAEKFLPPQVVPQVSSAAIYVPPQAVPQVSSAAIYVPPQAVPQVSSAAITVQPQLQTVSQVRPTVIDAQPHMQTSFIQSVPSVQTVSTNLISQAAAPNTLSTSEQGKIKILEPDSFDGSEKGPEISEYLIHFEQIALWNRWGPEQKARMLTIKLKGEAQKLLSTLTLIQLSDFETLKEALLHRFNPKERQLAYRCEFRNRRKQTNENPVEFGSALRCLGRKAYPDLPVETLEVHLVDQYVMGLGSLDLQKHVQLQHPKNLDQAVNLALEYTAICNVNTNKVMKPSLLDSDGTDKITAVTSLKPLESNSSEDYEKSMIQIFQKVLDKSLDKVLDKQESISGADKSSSYYGNSSQRVRSPSPHSENMGRGYGKRVSFNDETIPKRYSPRKIICTYCKKFNHTENFCRKKRADEEKRQQKQHKDSLNGNGLTQNS
ncbi:MAG: hypothetical protein AB2693_27250 [Candidatus Thiodiazotropha sp.]